MSFYNEEDFNEYGDYIEQTNWEIGQRVELDSKTGKLIEFSCDGDNLIIQFMDGTTKYYDIEDEEFSKLKFK